MTSKRCFSKIMREDFRHKIWMLALSILGNLLALPVVYLISSGDRRYYDVSSGSLEELTYRIQSLEEFFLGTMIVSGGIIAVAGALIVGLFGFRYVFRRNMVDTYHSMPVRRRTLFAAGWLNGFLIWFIPFLASVIITLILGEGRLSALKKNAEMYRTDAAAGELMETWVTGGGLVLDALWSILALTTAFLLVYHLVLLAVMLCGNLLNTLVAAAVLGLGAVSVYGIFLAYFSSYMDTFLIAGTEKWIGVVYASPLASAVRILYLRMESQGDLPGVAVLSLLIAAALGAFALAVYLRRPSELAEQGIINRPLKFLVQIVVSVVAAMGGWLVFDVLTRGMMGRNMGLVWSIFGALLAGIIVFGVMDIIFRMDFKAFFAHKALLAGVTAASLLICFAFFFDWFGYDSYLPEAEEIAEISVYDYNRSSIGRLYTDLDNPMHPINQVSITDQTAARAFLEAAVDYAENGFPKESGDTGDSASYVAEPVYTKVTLKNGRSYYRMYFITNYDNDAAYGLLTSREYLDANFRIGSGAETAIIDLTARQGDICYELKPDTEKNRETINAFCEAYNRDIEENPDAFIRGDGRLLGIVTVRIGGYGSDSQYRYLDIYEGMSNTREALRLAGLGECAEPVAAQEIEELRLGLNRTYAQLEAEAGPAEINLVEMACGYYGVSIEGTDLSPYGYEASDLPAAQTMATYGSQEQVELVITDAAEIEELLPLLSYEGNKYSNGIFRPEQVRSVTLIDKSGKESIMCISKGTLPEKYILRFGELQKEPAEAGQSR